MYNVYGFRKTEIGSVIIYLYNPYSFTPKPLKDIPASTPIEKVKIGIGGGAEGVRQADLVALHAAGVQTLGQFLAFWNKSKENEALLVRALRRGSAYRCGGLDGYIRDAITALNKQAPHIATGDGLADITINLTISPIGIKNKDLPQGVSSEMVTPAVIKRVNVRVSNNLKAVINGMVAAAVKEEVQAEFEAAKAKLEAIGF